MAGYSIEKVFQEARDNARRAKINFNAIIEKYSKEFVDDDTVDVLDNVIIADKGFIRKSSKKSFGTTRLKTTKRKEESQAGFISGSESECSFQTTNYEIIKEETYDETSPDLLQDLVNSFVQDPGYEPSDAETISSGSSSSSRITDDEDSLSEEDEAGTSPIIIKDEPESLHDNPLDPNRWYSLSKYNNYNPRDTVNGLPQSRPTPTKISIVTPEIFQDDGNFPEPDIVKPTGQSNIHKSVSNNPQPPTHSARKRVPFNTLQLYGPEQSNKTFTMNSPRPGFVSESSANNVTIIPTTDDSGDCFVVLSDNSMCIDQQQSSPTVYLNQNNNTSCEFSSSALQSSYICTGEKAKSSVTPRRKLKPKKSNRQPRFRTFSNEDLQMFFASNDPIDAEKIISPPECNRSNEPGTAMSFNQPTENRKKEVSKSLSILAMFNQIKSKHNKSPERNPLETGNRSSEKTPAFDSSLQNLDLSPSSHLATLRLRESPSHKAVNQKQAASVNDLQATGRRQRIGRQFRSTIALSDLQVTANRASFNDFKKLQDSQVRQSAPPLTSENLRIFNEMNSSSCDLIPSPKRGSSIRSQSSVMILSPERLQSVPPVQKNLTQVTTNHNFDLTKSPRRSSSTQPLLRRLFNTNGTNPMGEAQAQERLPFKLQNATTRNKLGVVAEKIGPDRVHKTMVADQCLPPSENLSLGKNPQITNLTLFENLFQTISNSQQSKATSSLLAQGSRNSSLIEMSNTSSTVIQPILHQNRTSKSVSSPSKTSSPQNTRQSLRHSKSTIPLTAGYQDTKPRAVNVSRSLVDFNIQMAESSEHISVDQTGLLTNQLSSMKSLSSDSSTVNIHMPASNNDIFLPRRNTRPMVCATTSVQSNPSRNSSDMRISKRRQSKSLEFEESTLQNDLNTSPNKERRMDQQNRNGFHNGFVIPQASNIIKPVPKMTSQCGNIIRPVPRGSQVRRRAPSKAMDSIVTNQNKETIYEWQSDSSQSSGHFQRPIPKFFSLSSASSVSPQPINSQFETSTPRKTTLIRPQSSILNDSMSTISSELPNFADIQNG
ncbi:hypothetical protein LOTGIDRAFT_171180 [Lottia gigantea]|uniref:Uncharacterized protein n=1 Tax=Lottia gigantea TaxID=225164 RepID=V4B7R2_LOTGI|nr:hypothetical protein LOTGIDRAFT_171180 [Lottia gigantea]ESP03651.1 hypothetical protein LOTGIDRAFT_171180 [Lottia gigantea]